MNEGERAGWWALAYLSLIFAVLLFNIICISWYYIKG
jgi:hypothetical protein